jgi:hypothetical protein
MTSGTIEDKIIVDEVWSDLSEWWDKRDKYKTDYPSVRAQMKKIRKDKPLSNRIRSYDCFCHDIQAILKGVYQTFVWSVRSALWKKMPEERRVSYKKDRLTHFLTDEEQNNGYEN